MGIKKILEMPQETSLYYPNGGGVIAISYGAFHKFRISNKITKDNIIDIPPTSYSLIQMGGDFRIEFSN